MGKIFYFVVIRSRLQGDNCMSFIHKVVHTVKIIILNDYENIDCTTNAYMFDAQIRVKNKFEK